MSLGRTRDCSTSFEGAANGRVAAPRKRRDCIGRGFDSRWGRPQAADSAAAWTAGRLANDISCYPLIQRCEILGVPRPQLFARSDAGRLTL
jgi:hypothetical protein